MHRKKLKYLFPLLVSFAVANAQEQTVNNTTNTNDAAKETVNPNSETNPDAPKRYRLGAIKVTGNYHFNELTIFTYAGLEKGQVITLPGEEISNAIKKLWKTGYFSDINVYESSIEGDVLNLEIYLNELPRLKDVQITGIKKSKKEEILKDLQLAIPATSTTAGKEDKKIKIVEGKIINDNLISTTKNYLTNKYRKDGFYNTKVTVSRQLHSDKKTADLLIDINKGSKVRISDIDFNGNNQLSDAKLRKAMKKTKQRSPLNPLRIFKPSKFIENEYKNDLANIINAYKEKGYRDARIISEKATYDAKKNTVAIDIDLEEGKKYYIGDIRFIGNSEYTSQGLRTILGMQKGEVYNGVLLEKRVKDPTNPDAMNIENVYQNAGYLWSQVNLIETATNNDTIDFDVRIFEGPVAHFNNVTVSGNDKTHDYIILRELRTLPGQKWSKADLIETIRRLGSMGIFDASALNPDIKNADPETATVDVDYPVVENGQSQVEVQGGYGGGTFIGTLALSFNNFSVRNLFNKEAYKPFPMGDAQKMSLRLQAATYFQTYSLSFSEPWFGGRRPISLFGSISYTSQKSFNFRTRDIDRSQGLNITTATLGMAKRLLVPDDAFTLSHSLSFQYYELNNYFSNFFAFKNGSSRNLAYTIELSRDNRGGIMPAIYPQSGAFLSVSGKFTAPYSLFNNVDYKNLENMEEYKYKTTSVQTNPVTGADIPVGTYLDKNGMPVTDYRDARVDQDKINQKKFNWLEYYKINFKADWYTTLFDKLVLRSQGQFGFLGAYNNDRGIIPFERFYLGGSGMMMNAMDGRENVALRGYTDNSLSPSRYDDELGYEREVGGTVYNKFSLELRYPISLKGQMSAYVLTFFDAGAAYEGFANYNPFKLQRSAGAGVRVHMPMFGLLGIDFGYGFDKIPGRNEKGGWQTHFILGQQF
ncbi:BamA/OMP85 family outer membrane protein [Paenimyroides aestuarii]|uniref:BamA/TamA family outer membrane protein n=1 Tax=Paenimyroides aestuarii TaxID=2968490 RepID=A0ABY5NPB4_9FLAO|nr:POTRA domain-containing protein [Paenimyroides aestuarii]UUV20351.1 BamA/TamA family outer membrane protein [Paenimyroides aestuarii]